jgi:deoxyribose-phosphate aldolase
MDAISALIQSALSEEKNKGYDRITALKNILGLMDLTTLEGSDNERRVQQLCMKAVSLKDTGIGVDSVAAVCVYPVFVATAKKMLTGSRVRVAAVAGGFPSGQMPLHLRLEEVRWTVDQGADEIDMVISRGKMLGGDIEFITQEVKDHKKACGSAHLKVILETGELQTPELIRQASNIAIEAGADFIKTSTGKVQPAATPEASWVMLHAIREHFEKTGKKIGFKPAGGIATAEDAIDYYLLVRHILGEQWLCPELFRYGASRLFDSVLKAVTEID